MTEALKAFHPAGWTDRRTYRLAVLVGAASLLIIGGMVVLPGLPSWIMAAVAMTVSLLLLLLTIRRLRDAGLSVWIILLALFPLGISVDVATVEAADFTLRFIDFAAIIKSVPILLGLALPSQPAERRVL